MLKFAKCRRKVRGEVLPHWISRQKKSVSNREKQAGESKRSQYSSHARSSFTRSRVRAWACPACPRPGSYYQRYNRPEREETDEHIVRHMVCDCQGYQGKPGDDEHPAILVVLHRLISSQDREQKCCDGKGQRFVTKYGVEEKEMGIGHIDHRRNPCHATRHRHLLVKEVQRQDHQQAGGGYDDASRRKCVQAAHRAERVRHNFKSGIKRTHREQRIDAEEVLRLQYSIRG